MGFDPVKVARFLNLAKIKKPGGKTRRRRWGAQSYISVVWLIKVVFKKRFRQSFPPSFFWKGGAGGWINNVSLEV